MITIKKTNPFSFQTRLARERVSKLIIQLQSTSFNEENLIHLANLIKFGFKPNTDANLMVNKSQLKNQSNLFFSFSL